MNTQQGRDKVGTVEPNSKKKKRGKCGVSSRFKLTGNDKLTLWLFLFSKQLIDKEGRNKG